MASVAQFTVDADQFPLGSIFADFSGVEVELERIVPTGQAIVPYLWIRGIEESTDQEIEAAFRKHPDVRNLQRIDEVDGARLIRVEWGPNYHGILRALTEIDVSLVSGTGTADRWTFEIRADERERIAEFQQRCLEYGISIELQSLHALAAIQSGTEYDLTEAQREALVLAYERGYFESPRAVKLTDIAAELDITQQSLGSRIRRGTKHLVRSTLIES